MNFSIEEQVILKEASSILASKIRTTDALNSPDAVKQLCQYKTAHQQREVFCVLLLDNQHRLIEFGELFHGTIDSASVYPREVVKLALEKNAAAVIFSHNHPSGVAEPSQSDRRITRRLADALALVDIRTLDHIVVSVEGVVSFAERGWI
ncbi:RadC family protein [Vibrio europaeus]|uniref:DNA repair protein RadC n=1 Tax=Vibrio europaeus TaxID=300876 RepID=A0A178J392_9VIBR|nr:DNA repair protein RadC [Vibrio europaeus]MDC5708414.1 DNA repair protein RadC [Vibrio europaeus]MDC5713146.1 DNA repair protein RadC [Vibrio europaeus]MDC5728153.1 DNA repair protein RadC [Vibrio europaeus]MDC5733252.1 DNA repair protein RadC [Vibrio europaeus]MDC5742370.1 DNA repair protein RadC [Vibrio europaeus]